MIGAIFTGLSALLVGWSQIRTQRAGASGSELRAGRRERKRLEDQMLAIRQWAIAMEQRLRELGERAPRRPPQVDLDWGREDDAESKSPVRLVGR